MATNKTRKLRDCTCSEFELDTDVNTAGETTGCTQTTHSMFAMGHDAKLVGFLVRAEMAGRKIVRRRGGMLETYSGAFHAAASVSQALAVKAEGQLDAAFRRQEKKGRKSAKAAVKIEETPQPRPATIKVGRWTYDATIDPKTSWATYTKKNGETVSIASTDYTEV